jgi:hypothetical protein
MPRAFALLFIAILAAGFSGCVSSGDPNLITDSKWIGGLSGGVVALEARRINYQKYLVEARGAGHCREAQVMQGWVYLADKVAAGRKYTRSTTTDRYEYTAAGPYMTTSHVGFRIRGEILFGARPAAGTN